MHLWRTAPFLTFTTFVVFVLFASVAVSQESIAVSDMTMSINESGAIHFKIVETTPSSRDGIATFHFELQKQYRPENVSIYDYNTGKPLKYTTKDLELVTTYDVAFDRPYYNGYTFVIEYDNHNRIVDESKGVYSIGFRPGVDISKVERISAVILPPKNFTYLDYNHALDKPISVEDVEGSKVIRFRNVSSAPADYAWEIKFRAVGIKDEVRTPKAGSPVNVPGMTAFLAFTAIAVVARLYKRKV